MKALIGLALLPLAWSAAVAALRLLAGLRPGEVGSHRHTLLALAAGFLAWIAIFIITPRTTRLYVLGHELTHAFWALLMGARVSKLRVHRHGGSVVVSKSNWIISLAPYFFPFYTMLVIGAAALVARFVDITTYEPLVFGMVGLTYGFHVTSTISMLTIRQPDIHEHGRLFSYSIILLLNAIGIALWIIAVGSPDWTDFVGLLTHECSKTLVMLNKAMQWAFKFAYWLIQRSSA
ncbi:MAG: M50 family metallopeptidase [Kiritimatiellae bacterium]|nr:M50 family metallopeptidase [Kiritimatiellia bacterium]MDW8459001.1 M50 family metallopeptidase [Verrucomicrobiota bacterium]